MTALNRSTLLAVTGAALLVLILAILALWAIHSVGLSDDIANLMRELTASLKAL